MKKLTAIFLSVLTLAINARFTVGTHYCQGDKVLSKVMLERAELECGMAWLMKACEKTPAQKCKRHSNKLPASDSFSKPNCCETVYQTFEPDVELAFGSVESKNTKPAAPLFEDRVFTFQWVPLILANYHNYYPPPLKNGLSILFQVFRL